MDRVDKMYINTYKSYDKARVYPRPNESATQWRVRMFDIGTPCPFCNDELREGSWIHIRCLNKWYKISHIATGREMGNFQQLYDYLKSQ